MIKNEGSHSCYLFLPLSRDFSESPTIVVMEDASYLQTFFSSTCIVILAFFSWFCSGCLHDPIVWYKSSLTLLMPGDMSLDFDFN